MNPTTAVGVLCGVGLGVGLWSIVSCVPRLSRPRLAERVAPHILDVSEPARAFVARRTVEMLPALGILLGPLVGLMRRVLGVLGSETIERRLRQSRTSGTAEEFRITQVVWAVIGLAAGILMLVAVAPFRQIPLAIQLVAPVVFAVCSFVLRDWLLQLAAKRRLRRIASEFPTVVEFLALSLAAGEGVLDSLRRVSRTSSGELAAELARVVAEVNTGIPLAEALHELSVAAPVPVLGRCVDAMTTALERGSPLAEVLRAQAQDARDVSKRELLEVAGKKEVAMLVPLVFLILPVTVLFAIYPGVFVLQTGF